MFFRKEYRLNSLAWSYLIWKKILNTTSALTGAEVEAGSRSQNFDIPAPAKCFGSLRLRLHNTDFSHGLLLNVESYFQRSVFRKQVPQNRQLLIADFHIRVNPNPCGWGRIWIPKL
jgi:hypothetical protein